MLLKCETKFVFVCVHVLVYSWICYEPGCISSYFLCLPTGATVLISCNSSWPRSALLLFNQWLGTVTILIIIIVIKLTLDFTFRLKSMHRVGHEKGLIKDRSEYLTLKDTDHHIMSPWTQHHSARTDQLLLSVIPWVILQNTEEIREFNLRRIWLRI